jgi:2-C-methyl-D-erythritol 4-phosphate cytidylyltransferase
MSTTDDLDVEPAMGVVPVEGRGSMPFALLHGESLVAVASWALGEAGVRLLDFTTSWPDVQSTGRPLVVHDPLCPGTSVGFLREAVEVSAADDTVVVGVLAVTDTVKRVEDDVVRETIDRAGLVAVTSPLVLPGAVVAELPDPPDLDDLAALVAVLRKRFPVRLLDAPSLGRRVVDASDLALLEAASGS